MGSPPSQAVNDQSLILQQSTAPLQLFRKKVCGLKSIGLDSIFYVLFMCITG